MSDTNFGDWLKKWRSKRKLSTRNLATLLGVSQTYIWKIENNKVSPSLRFLRQLSATFKAPEAYLAAGRLIPEKELKTLKNIPTPVEKSIDFVLDFIQDERSGFSPILGSYRPLVERDDPDLAKFFLDVFLFLKNKSYNKKDLDFIQKMIKSYFSAKEGEEE